MPRNIPVLNVRGLTKSWGDRVILKNVNFQLFEGDRIVILGLNGSGKSTLLSAISSLMLFETGTIEIFGHDIQKHRLKALEYLGVMPQTPYFNKDVSIIDHLTTYAGLFGIDEVTANTRAVELLTASNLIEYQNLNPYTLSVGMMRRLLVVRSLINNPKLLILDEPTAGADASNQMLMWKLINKRLGTDGSLILISHIEEECMSLASSCAYIKDGSIEMQKSKNAIADYFHNIKYLEMTNPEQIKGENK